MLDYRIRGKIINIMKDNWILDWNWLLLYVMIYKGMINIW